MCRVRQRAEDVEDGADAEFLADGADVLHRGVILLGEHEADANLLELLDDFSGRLVEVDAERFEAVGGTALRGSGAVAVLGDFDACCGDDHGRSRRDVDAVRVVAARADDVEHIHRMLDLERMVAHGHGRARYLIDCLCLRALRRERREVGGILDLCRLAVHDLIHDGVGFVVSEILFADDLLNGFFDHRKPSCRQ